ncbi:MAG: hypothetical protein KGZ71_01115 [Desulfobulbaceae bacterium]|nr:hypothetical protein [Candidatus Kapabacteria bacterium]MBS3999060.1 hypothetical protein [Desulfobulbaceae bacterium]
MNFKLLLKTSALAVCFISFFALSDATAQNFISDGATADYNATCGAVIRMKSNSSAIQNINTANLGSSANVIPGVVDWAGNGGAQTVQGLYYSLLYTSGSSTKNVEDGVFVMGGACATFLPGYDDLATYPYYATGGDRTYAGTFTYGSSDPQNIFPETTGSSGTDYNILALTGGGTKTILGADDVGTAVNIDSDAGTTLAVVGELYTGTGTSTLDGDVEFNDVNAELIVGTGPVDFNGDVDVNSGTISAATGAGEVTIGATSTLTLGGDDSILDFADNTNLTITGDIINSGNGLNLFFACLSTVTYDGTQNPQLVMPTLTSNPYGNLVLTGGAKRGDAASNYANDVFLCNNFALTGGNFDMFTNTGTLTMQAVAGTAIYGGGPGNEEVVGSMARTMDAAAGSYTFNNRNTTIDLDADANNPTLATIEMRPGQGSSMGAWDGARDVNRSVNLTHNAANDFDMELAVGYLFSEGPGAWAAPNTQASIRFHEGNGPDDEKIGTGQVYNRTAAAGADLGQVSLAGILRAAAQALPNDIDRFASGNDVILRAGPTTFYTVDDGRWTNPNTWDEGTQPSSLDDTELRHMVYVGIDGPFAGTIGGADNTAANNTLAESDHYGTDAAARTINIASGYANASLVIGNEDNPASYIFSTSFASGSSFLNNNTNAPGAAFPYAIAKASAAKANFNGLWLINSLGAGTPGFGTYQIENTGTINNEGVIEVGE